MAHSNGNDSQLGGPNFSLKDNLKPRIRDITGIRIHQLTLPESLFYASKFVASSNGDAHDSDDGDDDGMGYNLGEGSKLIQSPGSTSRRRTSSSSFPFPNHFHSVKRERRTSDTPLSTSFHRPRPKSERRSTTSSNGTITPQSPSIPFTIKPRVTRPRAPTLAGEALEHTLSPNAHSTPLPQTVAEVDTHQVPSHVRLARCFVVFKLPDQVKTTINGHEIKTGDGTVPAPKRTQDGIEPLHFTEKIEIIRRPRLISSSSTSSSSSSVSASSRNRPSLSTNSSSSSLTRTISPPTSLSTPTSRQRTSSLTSPQKHSPLTIEKRSSSSGGRDRVAQSRHASRLSESARRPGLSSSASTSSISKLSMPNGKLRSTLSSARQDVKDVALTSPQANVPFFISPIHSPSTHPSFLSLSAETDFAPWLTVQEGASSLLEMELWVEIDESRGRWVKVDRLGGVVHMDQLRKGAGDVYPANTIQFTLNSDPKTVFYLPRPGTDQSEAVQPENKVVERSMRETRMKRGAGVGALHQLINMYAVITDTERSIAEVQRKLDRLLESDVDRRKLRRDVKERENRIRWLKEKITEVEKATEESLARNTLHRQNLDKRRHNLVSAREQDALLLGQSHGLGDEFASVERERTSLLPIIHHLRATHVQTLDNLFPIFPLDPSNLLYTILSVPLPIPSGPKDPAPPLTVPQYKVDERTTAAALGYVAMIVHLLSTLCTGIGMSGQGQGQGLPYPITCAGSRSTVKDVVSVMQGPRSFPLFAKGVERYRYEYAVFLLNKNIEMLMQESNIRLLDLRHTLPNLKNLLLTLSSPDLPPAPKMWRTSTSTTTTLVDPGSRRPSTAWGSPASAYRSPGSSVAHIDTGAGSPLSLGTGTPTGNVAAGMNTSSPLADKRKLARRSMLSRDSARVQDEGNEDQGSSVGVDSELDDEDEEIM